MCLGRKHAFLCGRQHAVGQRNGSIRKHQTARDQPGVECSDDAPLHFSQSQRQPTDINLENEALLDKTRVGFSQEPYFDPFDDWQGAMHLKLTKLACAFFV